MISTGKLLRFIVVGFFVASIYSGLLFIGVERFDLNATLVSSLAYLIVVVLHYLLSYFWTFEISNSHARAMRRYLFMISCGFVFNGIIMYMGVSILGINYLMVQTTAVVAIVLWNFTLSSLWVFRA